MNGITKCTFNQWTKHKKSQDVFLKSWAKINNPLYTC